MRRILVVSAVAAAPAALLAVVATRSHSEAAMLRADPETLLADPALRDRAIGLGRTVYTDHCAACHDQSGKGDRGLGIPDLTDNDRLYGEGSVAEIELIARYGIRSGDKRGWNLASMPAYAKAVPYKGEPLPSLRPAEIDDIVQYLFSFTGRTTDAPAASRGRAVFATSAGCWDCHGRYGEGDPGVGAPDLTDDVWLYGGGRRDLFDTIARGRAGYSPAFARSLTPVELRAVAVYVAALAPPAPRQGTR